MSARLSFDGTVGVSTEGVSDLFFNTEHPNLDEYFKEKAEAEADIDPAEAFNALLKDAESFITAFGEQQKFSAADLVNDYMARV